MGLRIYTHISFFYHQPKLIYSVKSVKHKRRTKHEMTDNDGTEDDEVALLKKEVADLKEKLNSVSESALSRTIETQKLKIRDAEETTMGISGLFRESKISSVLSLFLPLLPAMFAWGIARAIITGILQGQTEILHALVEFGFNAAPMLNLMPPLIFIAVYVVGFKITSCIAGIIVKHRVVKSEKNELRLLLESRPE